MSLDMSVKKVNKLKFPVARPQKEWERMEFSEIKDTLLHDKDVKKGYRARNATLQAARFVLELRERNGLTQIQLAERMGVSQAMVAKLESGKSERGPTVGTLSRVATACGEALIIGHTAGDKIVFPYSDDTTG